jgi:hypothetical protein
MQRQLPWLQRHFLPAEEALPCWPAMPHEESGRAPAQDVPQCQARCACLASPLACHGQGLAGRVKGTAQRMGYMFLHTGMERLLTPLNVLRPLSGRLSILQACLLVLLKHIIRWR